uniref:Hedgehog/Intein (Hint) domain-containing protein n=1 Tax=viral metagenome TaxID=1070528 RepID=A0A6C0LM00_9ZZZZ
MSSITKLIINSGTVFKIKSSDKIIINNNKITIEGDLSDSNCNLEINNAIFDGVSLPSNINSLIARNTQFNNINGNDITVQSSTLVSNTFNRVRVNKITFNSSSITQLIAKTCVMTMIFNDTTVNSLLATGSHIDLKADANSTVTGVKYFGQPPKILSGSSNIVTTQSSQCFVGDSYIKTKCGMQKIKNISNDDLLFKNMKVKKLHKFPIKNNIYLIEIPPNSLSKYVPNKTTYVTPLHMVYYNNEYVFAYKLINVNNIKIINKYVDYLYNITLENNYDSFICNNMFSISYNENINSDDLDIFVPYTQEQKHISHELPLICV